MDIGAFEMCREAKLPILVFDYKQEGAIERAIAGHPIGTIVSRAGSQKCRMISRLARVPAAWHNSRTNPIQTTDQTTDQW